MNPKHKNPTQKKRTARAPYNFVPLPEKVLKSVPLPEMDRYGRDDRYTGVIECEIITESPVYVRCALKPELFRDYGDKPLYKFPDEKKEEYARFFNLGDPMGPVIPGSSLRGMVRTIVEIAAYGKMQWVTDKPLVFRAVGDTTSLGTYYRKLLMQDDGDGKKFTPLMRAGYLIEEKGRWFIRPAQTVQGVTFARIHQDKIPAGLSKWHDDCRNAERIWVKPGEYAYQNVKGGFLEIKYLPVLNAKGSKTEDFIEAVLARSGKMNNIKKLELVVFPPDESIPVSELIEVDDDMLQRYRDQVTQEQESLLGEKGALNHYQPVFYLLKDEELVFFGHTMMFRLPYDSTPYGFVPPSLKGGNPEIETDMAEAIFGFTSEGEDKRGFRAGRVFFGDARLEPKQEQEEVWLEEKPIAPKILSGPKPTAFQHYLTQQQPDKVETGSYKKNGSPRLELRLDHYASPPPHETVIRGHKLYWHKDNVNISDIKDNSRKAVKVDKQHTLIKPVKSGVKFRSSIHFENLAKEELGALLWALILPGEQGKEYRHKIGMGKPFGMGSIKIAPELYLDDRSSRYCRLFDGQNWHQARSVNNDCKKFIDAFEIYILENMSPDERRGTIMLSKVERLQMLLKMLEWSGLKDGKLMEYMTMPEFRKRPVLPDPLHVEAASADSVEMKKERQGTYTKHDGYYTGLMAEAFKRAKRITNKER